MQEATLKSNLLKYRKTISSWQTNKTLEKADTHIWSPANRARTTYIINRALTVTVPVREESYKSPLQRPILMLSFMTHRPSMLRYAFLGKPVLHLM